MPKLTWRRVGNCCIDQASEGAGMPLAAEALCSQLEGLVESVAGSLKTCHDLQGLRSLRAQALGKKSWLFEKLQSLKRAGLEERQHQIPQLQSVRQQLEALFEAKQSMLTEVELQGHLEATAFDGGLPALSEPWEGSRAHPIASTLTLLVNHFREAGFKVVEGPEVEHRYYNFDALNFPKNHPALARKDSFWLGPEHLLRTHTSGVQVRVMEKGCPPFRMISPGRVFRPDSDPTHTPMFHQLEGLVVDGKVNFGHLKWTLEQFLYKFFEGSEIKIRFRPSTFPFTVPSGEVDIQWPDNEAWIEVLGCGMVHPNLLKRCRIDPETFQGFAFGMGVERLTMLRYRLNDLRPLFENDLRFLAQFP